MHLHPCSSFNALVNWMSNYLMDCNVLILGDFNLTEINWDSLSGSTLNSTLLCDFIFNFNLTQLILSSQLLLNQLVTFILTNILLLTQIIIWYPLTQSWDVMCTSLTQVLTFLTTLRLIWKVYQISCCTLISKTCLNSVDIEYIWTNLRSLICDAINRSLLERIITHQIGLLLKLDTNFTAFTL